MNNDMKLVGQDGQPSKEQIRAQMKKEAEQIKTQIKNASTDFSADDPASDQYANMHTKLVQRLIGRMDLMNVELDKRSIMEVAGTIQSLMKEKILLAFVEYLANEGVIEDIGDIITEDVQDEIIGYFQIQQDLEVDESDLEGLDI